MAVGSCFAEHLAGKLKRYLFPVVQNPYGILYNPLSLARALTPDWLEPQLFLYNGLWRSLHHHSSLAWSSREHTLQLLANAERYKQHALQESRWLVLTLGTGHAFCLVSNGEVVANCHRLPNQLFRRRLLEVEECLCALEPALRAWLTGDPERQLLLSVSPVRYLRDGLVENSRGKAILHLLCRELESRLERVHYFPAYEIVCDELRSYRYFERDMVRPNDLAVDIVWQRFVESYLRPEEVPVLAQLEKLWQAFEHEPTPHTDLPALGQNSMRRLEQVRRSAPKLDFHFLEERFQAMLDGSIKG